MCPVGSTSSSARYGAPPFVRSRRLALTAKTPSTTRSASQIGDHLPSLALTPAVASRPVTTISPFRALRYDEAVAGLARRARRAAVRRDRRGRPVRATGTASDVQHRPPDAARTRPEAAGERRSPLARGAACCVEEEPALWWIAQDYIGPDGVERTREGIAGSIEATPYSEGKVLPHERTHAGPKEGRLRAAARDPHAARADLPALRRRPAGRAARPASPRWTSRRAACARSVWRLPAEELEIDVPLLIADGHHRYETAVAFREEEPSATHTFAVLVSSRDPGPRDLPDAPRRPGGRRRARTASMTSTWDTSLADDVPRRGTSSASTPTTSSTRARSSATSSQGVDYTPDAEEAIDAVDDGAAELGVPRARADGRAGRSSSPRAARRCRRSRRSSTRSSPPASCCTRCDRRSVSPWLELCRAAVADVKAVLAEMPTREERERPIGQGKGGDVTAALDEAAETGRARALRPRRTSGSSRRRSGSRARARSPSSSTRSTARRTPSGRSRTSRSASRSPRATTMDDVVFGFVYDFGADEEWTAVRGGGAFLNGKPLTGRAEGLHRVPLDRGDARRRSCSTGSRSSRRSPIASGSWARRRSPSATSRRAAPTRVVVPEAVADGRLRRRAAARPRARLLDPGRSTGRRSARSRSTSRRARASAPPGTTSSRERIAAALRS